MKIALIGHRQWARELMESVACEIERLSLYDLTVESRSTTPKNIGIVPSYDMLVYIGWSEMVPSNVYENTLCLVLHPSPLPRYRGGTPIQHQIIAGEMHSAVTLFKLDKAYPGIDAGPIAWQMGFSLEGTLDQILNRIAVVGALGVVSCIQALYGGNLTFYPQEVGASPMKRRTPEQSQILPEHFQNETALRMHNFIRALQDPYPEPWIRCADGKRLYFLKTRLEDDDEPD